MFSVGPTELILILVVALLVVGPKRLPEVGKTIGKSLREFRKAQEDLKESFNFDLDDSKPKPPPARGAVEDGSPAGGADEDAGPEQDEAE